MTYLEAPRQFYRQVSNAADAWHGRAVAKDMELTSVEVAGGGTAVAVVGGGVKVACSRTAARTGGLAAGGLLAGGVEEAAVGGAVGGTDVAGGVAAPMGGATASADDR